MAKGSLPAGIAAEISDEYDLVDLNEMLTRGREGCRLARIKGSSVKDRIPDNAIVAYDPNAKPRNGSLIVFSINGEQGVKEFRVTDDRRFYIVPRNADDASYQPREVTSRDSFHILGVVLGTVTLFNI